MDQNTLQQAMAEHRNGNVDEAIRRYEALLEQNHTSPDLYYLIGVASRQTNQLEKSENFLKLALSFQNDTGKIYYELGITLMKAGKGDEAIRCFTRAVDSGFSGVGIYTALADTHRKMGDYDKALEWYLKVCAEDANNFYAHFCSGMLYRESLQLAKAEDHFTRALEIAPDSAETSNNLGLLYQAMGKLPEALVYCKAAWDKKPQEMAIFHNYLTMLLSAGEYETANEILCKQLKSFPDSPELYNGLGNAFYRKKNYAEAKENYIKALQLKPGYAEAHFNVGLIMREWNMLDEALICFNNAIKCDQSMIGAYVNAGETLQTLGEIEKSEAIFNEVLKIDPDNQIVNDNILASYNYNPKYTPEQVFERHVEWGKRKGKQERRFEYDRDPIRKLKIGYVSPDFCKHPASSFIFPVLDNHERDAFDVYLFAEVIHDDERTDVFKATAQHWIETQDLSDDQLLKKITDEKIDILIDCSGHLQGNRLNVFAQRAAPVQLSVFGYPGTTGLSAIDYRISDPIIDPPHETHLYTETVIPLDKCFCCFAATITNAPETARAPAGKNGYITFGSLHTTARLNREVIGLWARVLKRIPASRMLLFRTSLCESVQKRIGEWFGEYGIDLSRITFQKKIPDKGYLTVYNDIDILLDTFPWSGHTTACEALWMGVPVLTLYGQTHAGRMVSSVLSNCGLEKWIAYSKEEYVHKAAEMTGSIQDIVNLRRQMRTRLLKSSLLNGLQYTRNLERVYREVWRRYCEDEHNQRDSG